jgi:acetyl-CoA carboxylase biotin carboxyl carrier protein
MATIDVVSPMAGSIKEILVSVGEKVTPGQEIIILESMKMEIPVESPGSGSITEILVTAATAVEEGQLLLRMDA